MDIPYKIRKDTMEHVSKYAKKLGYTYDQIQDFALFLESIESILKRGDPGEWDRVGTKLVNGKVKFPGNFETLLNELLIENEFNAWFVDEKYGGYGYSFIFIGAVSQLMTYFDSSFNITCALGLIVLEALQQNSNEYIEDIIKNFVKGQNTGFAAFTEPNAGSNLESIKSSSYLEGDEYVLNGTKVWISNGGYGNSGLIMTTNMENGKQNGHNVFAVENPKNLVCERLEEKSGLKASPTGQLRFEDLRVPKEALVGEAGKGYTNVLERLMSMRVGVALQAAATMERAYDLAYEYANTREQFGKPIISFDGVSRKLKAMEIQLPRMKKYGFEAAYAYDRFSRGYVPLEVGASGPTSEQEAAKLLPDVVRAGLAHYFTSGSKMYCSEISQHFVYDAAQLFGGNAFVSENEINKIMRDVRVQTIYEGTSEIHEWLLQKTMKAVKMVPTIKPMIAGYSEETVYEKMFFARFPKIRGLI